MLLFHSSFVWKFISFKFLPLYSLAVPHICSLRFPLLSTHFTSAVVHWYTFPLHFYLVSCIKITWEIYLCLWLLNAMRTLSLISCLCGCFSCVCVWVEVKNSSAINVEVRFGTFVALWVKLIACSIFRLFCEANLFIQFLKITSWNFEWATYMNTNSLNGRDSVFA